jgi:hypothetical protein
MEQTCKCLYQILPDRQVWAGQLEWLPHEDPILGLAMPPLTSLSTKELKTLVINRAKLCRGFSNDHNNFGFAAQGITRVPRVCNILLMPGGKSLLAIDNEGVTLYRIGLEGDRASLSVRASVKFSQRTGFGVGRSTLITTASPCPILVHDQRNE